MNTQQADTQAVSEWANQSCQHIDSDGKWSTQANAAQIEKFPGWKLLSTIDGVDQLQKEFSFKGFDQVQKALQPILKIAETQDHHPEVTFSFNFVRVTWCTHSAGGISNNDWVCAAKAEQQLSQI